MTILLANFIKQLAQKRILTPHIDRYLEKGDFPQSWKFELYPNRDPDPYEPSFHPSGDCTLCVKQLYAKQKGFMPDDKSQASTQKNFAVGNFWHIWLQTIIVDGLGFATWDEVEKQLVTAWVSDCCGWSLHHIPVPPEDAVDHDSILWYGTGTADIAHCDVPGVGKFLVDFKTMNANHFSKDISELRYLTDKWEAQVNCYMDWLGDVDKAIIIGIKKDTPHEFREFVFDKNETLLYNIYRKWTEVAEALKSEIAPATCEHGDKCPADEYYRLRG